jgi:hypothetical protein
MHACFSEIRKRRASFDGARGVGVAFGRRRSSDFHHGRHSGITLVVRFPQRDVGDTRAAAVKCRARGGAVNRVTGQSSRRGVETT